MLNSVCEYISQFCDLTFLGNLNKYTYCQIFSKIDLDLSRLYLDALAYLCVDIYAVPSFKVRQDSYG